MTKTLIAVVGPTAIGKTTRAITLASHFGSEILSTDSRQFYKEMNIGTAVPSEAELRAVPHHFIQHLSIHSPWSVGDFEKAALHLLDKLFRDYDYIIAAGGSGLYLKALVEGLDDFPEVEPEIRQALNLEYREKGLAYLQKLLKSTDPEYYDRVDIYNPHRIIRALEVFRAGGRPYSAYLGATPKSRSFRTLYVGIGAERAEIYRRIDRRVDQMIDSGLVAEARGLIGYRDLPALQTVGYQELFSYFDGLWDLDQAVEEIKKNTRRYAKRQLSWWRKNSAVQWIDYNDSPDAVNRKVELMLKNTTDE